MSLVVSVVGTRPGSAEGSEASLGVGLGVLGIQAVEDGQGLLDIASGDQGAEMVFRVPGGQGLGGQFLDELIHNRF